MNKIFFAYLGIFFVTSMSTAGIADDFEAHNCANDSELKSRAERVLKQLKIVTKINDLFQMSTFIVDDINGENNCSADWSQRALGGGGLSIGRPPICGIILKTAKENLPAIA